MLHKGQELSSGLDLKMTRNGKATIALVCCFPQAISLTVKRFNLVSCLNTPGFSLSRLGLCLLGYFRLPSWPKLCSQGGFETLLTGVMAKREHDLIPLPK